jgi:hypothetical protein
VLGIGHSKGVSSIIVPGAGEANFDTMEVNPYATKRQRQEKEVKQLLEKVRYIGPGNNSAACIAWPCFLSSIDSLVDRGP